MSRAKNKVFIPSIFLPMRMPPAVRLISIALLFVLSLDLQLHAQKSAELTEYDVKSAYLYNFGKFVTWPAAPPGGGTENEPFTVCVLGRDPFGRALDTTLAGQGAGGKNAAARRITHPQDADGCRIIFISGSEEKRLKEILAALDKKAILTVSDMPQFIRRGGMIQFVTEQSRVRFEVNLTATESAGLTLSSELLKVATAVERNPLPGD